ncbi:2,3-butanediol dehydrogenase [Rhodococcus sp. SGAir0479]|uniref:2,3-butanediol dehydrogenase n=1 Tax=Rhodococcus sp. SGAir0479 TaxID=2567884 RepID=UPI0010CCB923|nr:2,3-butanediol dehydrogenase [Rhodococcus sp. SGAir0479]QCQ89775.1 2,3-butanediol dehydrogenase [Rhodococcus sp. SGAir0479]
MNVTGHAVRWHGAGDLRVDEVELPAPDAGQVLLRCAYCGACGSDLHEIHDGPHAIPTGTPHTLSGATAPIVLGHEFSGTVVAVGADVDGIAVGDAVAVEPNYRCGECPACRDGRYHTCRHFGFAGLMGDGGMAEYATVPAYMVHVLPAGFDLAQAAVLEPAAVALHAVRRSGIRTGASAAVIGLGPVGLLVCALLRRRGVDRLVGIDPVPERRALASRLGVPTVIDPRAVSDVPTAVRSAGGDDGVDVAFEVVGAQPTFETAVGSVRTGGTVVLLGLADELRFDAFDFVNDELTVVASVGYNDCHRELIDLVHRGLLDLTPFTADVVDLAEAPAVLTAMAAGGRRGVKTLVRCGGGTR